AQCVLLHEIPSQEQLAVRNDSDGRHPTVQVARTFHAMSSIYELKLQILIRCGSRAAQLRRPTRRIPTERRVRGDSTGDWLIAMAHHQR
ncbi:MAG TPA: hypothetical protein PKY13_12825, partial [Microthrixaceae bacterium]|nr:hypothetical protein [Microthrixaceae bacterium]